MRQVGQLGGRRQIIGLAVPQLSTLGVLGTGREAPPNADAEQFAGGGQERHRRRQARLAFQVGQVGALPDRGYLEGAHRADPGQVSARVNASDVYAGRSSPLQLDPVAVVLAPLHVIRDCTGHSRPGDVHGIDR